MNVGRKKRLHVVEPKPIVPPQSAPVEPAEPSKRIETGKPAEPRGRESVPTRG